MASAGASASASASAGAGAGVGAGAGSGEVKLLHSRPNCKLQKNKSDPKSKVTKNPKFIQNQK